MANIRTYSLLPILAGRVCRIFALIFLVVFLTNRPLLGQDANPRQAFLHDYEPHGIKLKDYYSNVAAKLTRTIGMGSGDSQVLEFAVKVKASSFLATTLQNRIINEKTGEVKKELSKGVEGRNPYYYFGVAHVAEKGYKLLETKMTGPKAFLPNSDLHFPISSSYRQQAYIDLGRDENVPILDYREVIWLGQTAKQLTYEHEYYDEQKKKNVREPVKAFFLPEQDWVCCGEELEGDGRENSVVRSVYTYERKGAGQYPSPVRVENTYGTKVLNTTLITEFTAVPPFDDAEFRMSAFGLPEPVGVPAVQRHLSQWYIWIALAAGAMIAVGISLFFIRRRYLNNSAAIDATTPSKEGGT